RHRRTDFTARLLQPDLCWISEIAFCCAIEKRRETSSHRSADVVRDDVLHDKLVHDYLELKLRLRICDLHSLRFSIETIEYRFHESEKVRHFFSNRRIGFDRRGEIFEVLLNVAGKFVSVIGAFSTGKNCSMNTLWMTTHRRKREVRPVADRPKADLICS